MVSASGISRRHMLAISAGLALANSRVSRAQAAKRIDQFAPEFDKVISTAEPILELATGFGGGGNTEGPVWWKEGGYLLAPIQIRSATRQHRRHGGVSGGGKGRGQGL
jgi:hypothetical protein